MKKFRTGRIRLIAGIAALLVVGSVGVAVAASSTSSNATSAGHGVPEFGLTKANFKGHGVSFRYTKGFFCDTSITATSTTGCEVGAKFKKAPSKHFDPLYILVPLGFKLPAMSMECPAGLICVDHPGTLDLTRIEPALKPLYPTLTDVQLTDALKNFTTPGHDHFITTTNGGHGEWWDVRVVGVTNKAEYNSIIKHKSTSYLLKQVKAGKTTPVIPSNLFLFFGVK
ncbi:MAG: hypothetical protein JWP74_3445 [Marmoricola sp.]|nr:hypothetical protein [Marmoricola sp.]